MNRLRRSARLAVVLVLAASCDRSKTTGGSGLRVDTALAAGMSASAGTTSTAPVVMLGWPTDLSGVLLAAGPTPDRAMVVAGDTSADLIALGAQHARVLLFSRDGRIRIAALSGVKPGTDSCTVGTVTSGGAPLRGWLAGLVVDTARPAPIALDSLGSLHKTDSIRLTSEINRLASIMPADSSDRFTGLPFIMHGMWRLRLPGDTMVVVALLDRRLNQEASPGQERTLIVAEFDTTTADSAVVAYSERSSGAEESVKTQDLLGALLGGTPQRQFFVFMNEIEDGTSLSLLERTGAHTWRLRWSGPTRRCF